MECSNWIKIRRFLFKNQRLFDLIRLFSQELKLKITEVKMRVPFGVTEFGR